MLQSNDNDAIKALNKISNGITDYAEILSKSANNSDSKLVKDLKQLEQLLTNNVQTTVTQTNSDVNNLKTKVINLKAAAETLSNKFDKFRKIWESTKIQDHLWIKVNDQLNFPLVNLTSAFAYGINTAKNYGDYIKIFSIGSDLGSIISNITDNLFPKAGDIDTVKSSLNELLQEITGSGAVHKFQNALNEFASVTSWPTTTTTTQNDNSNKNITPDALAKNIATKTVGDSPTYSGYLYQKGIVKSTLSNAKISLEDFSKELFKFDFAEDTKVLARINVALNNQLRFLSKTQITTLNNRLISIFNNGNVLFEK
ncbi:hypothetical protein J2Z62_000128 [Mycoplasmoides fastidiosum]|uniref:Uncharacterized protein n=1 Tax=Mycoplasmoides fastidiosum TaxID=92758 RepID=A0ABU0LYJ6_9BACT|nr:hypothetical protein [Mycoplasmoides fastidiosum]MDQ0513690.1 hypothetical protein [Mycoplasmoides fastidiosum]UUD37887.1 hypothetical protein NPA10_00620 [Mycoplasmoides fastidiosum]